MCHDNSVLMSMHCFTLICGVHYATNMSSIHLSFRRFGLKRHVRFNRSRMIRERGEASNCSHCLSCTRIAHDADPSDNEGLRECLMKHEH
jgi:hypothetical protein